MTGDREKICQYCEKVFYISQQSQQEALKKGGTIYRKYCNDCLLQWRNGKIDLESHKG